MNYQTYKIQVERVTNGYMGFVEEYVGLVKVNNASTGQLRVEAIDALKDAELLRQKLKAGGIKLNRLEVKQ